MGAPLGHIWQGNSNAGQEFQSGVSADTCERQDVVYDDFIANFTASTWDPKAWLDLFTDAGAKYFVIVTVRTAFMGCRSSLTILHYRNITMAMDYLIPKIRPIEAVYTSTRTVTLSKSSWRPPKPIIQTSIVEHTIRLPNGKGIDITSMIHSCC